MRAVRVRASCCGHVLAETQDQTLRFLFVGGDERGHVDVFRHASPGGAGSVRVDTALVAGNDVKLPGVGLELDLRRGKAAGLALVGGGGRSKGRKDGASARKCVVDHLVLSAQRLPPGPDHAGAVPLEKDGAYMLCLLCLSQAASRWATGTR